MKLQTDFLDKSFAQEREKTITMKLQTDLRQILCTGTGKTITMKLQSDLKSFAQEREKQLQ